MRADTTNSAVSRLRYTESFHITQCYLSNNIFSKLYRSSPSLTKAMLSSSDQFTAKHEQRLIFPLITGHQLHHSNHFMNFL